VMALRAEGIPPSTTSVLPVTGTPMGQAPTCGDVVRLPIGGPAATTLP
jgi:hypothetical protein